MGYRPPLMRVVSRNSYDDDYKLVEKLSCGHVLRFTFTPPTSPFRRRCWDCFDAQYGLEPSETRAPNRPTRSWNLT